MLYRRGVWTSVFSLNSVGARYHRAPHWCGNLLCLQDPPSLRNGPVVAAGLRDFWQRFPARMVFLRFRDQCLNRPAPYPGYPGILPPAHRWKQVFVPRIFKLSDFIRLNNLPTFHPRRRLTFDVSMCQRFIPSLLTIYCEVLMLFQGTSTSIPRLSTFDFRLANVLTYTCPCVFFVGKLATCQRIFDLVRPKIR